MACSSPMPSTGSSIDLSPLVESLRTICEDRSAPSYVDLAQETGVPLPKLLRLSHGEADGLDSLHLVNLARSFDIPLSDFLVSKAWCAGVAGNGGVL